MKKSISIPLHYIFPIYALVVLGIISQPDVVYWSNWLVYKILYFSLFLELGFVLIMYFVYKKAVAPKKVEKIPPMPRMGFPFKFLINGVILGIFVYSDKYLLSGLYLTHIIFSLTLSHLNMKLYFKLFYPNLSKPQGTK